MVSGNIMYLTSVFFVIAYSPCGAAPAFSCRQGERSLELLFGAQNSSVGVSPSFASSNPFFPATSPLRSPGTPTDSPAFHQRYAARKPPRLAQPADADSPRQVQDNDTDSLDSLVLDDGPNPVKVVTPGAASGCVRAFAPGSDAAPDSPGSAGQSPAADGADTQQAPDDEQARPASGSSEVCLPSHADMTFLGDCIYDRFVSQVRW